MTFKSKELYCTEKLTPENWAVIKHVWTLSEKSKEMVENKGYFILKTEDFLAKVDTSHPIKDMLTVAMKKYEVSYIGTSLSHIEEESKAERILVQLRTVKNTQSQVGICLITLIKENMNLVHYKDLAL